MKIETCLLPLIVEGKYDHVFVPRRADDSFSDDKIMRDGRCIWEIGKQYKAIAKKGDTPVFLRVDDVSRTLNVMKLKDIPNYIDFALEWLQKNDKSRYRDFTHSFGWYAKANWPMLDENKYIEWANKRLSDIAERGIYMAWALTVTHIPF